MDSLSKILIKGGTLVDGTGKAPLERGAVLVEGSRIVSVGREAEVAAPSNTQVLDASGKTVMPGLIDVHMHLAGAARDPTETNFGTFACLEISMVKTRLPMFLLYGVRNARLMIEAGFTTIRDMLGFSAHDNLSLRKAVELKLFPGPRVFTTGSLNQTGGHFDLYPWYRLYAQPPGWTVTGPWECRRKVRDYIGAGVDGIKTVSAHSEYGGPVYRNFTKEELAAIVDESHAFGKPVSAHTIGDDAILRSVEVGMDSIDHGVGDAIIGDEAIEAMKKARTIFVPTLSVYSDRAIEAITKKGRPKSALEGKKRKFEMCGASLKKMYDAGVRIALGSDTYRGLSEYVGKNAYELELMVRYGMSEMDAIVAGTKTGAEALHWQGKVGTVEPGKLADILVIDGDPLKDIRVLQDKSKLELVIKEGEIVVDRRDGYKKLLHVDPN